VNPDRLICGLATLFGTMAHSGVFWTARMFEGWLRSPITALPLRVNHSMLAIERGGLVITNVGYVPDVRHSQGAARWLADLGRDRRRAVG
jgi:hypothetical protein